MHELLERSHRILASPLQTMDNRGRCKRLMLKLLSNEMSAAGADRYVHTHATSMNGRTCSV